MNVFVARAGYAYEGSSIVGVFSTKEKAIGCFPDIEGDDHFYDYYEVTEHIVNETTADDFKNDGVNVYYKERKKY